MGIEALQQTFTVADSPGLDTLDPRLADITALAQDGKFSELRGEVQTLLDEGVYDIRLIGYFCFAVFLDDGVGALRNVYDGLRQVLDANWDAVGPVKNKEKHTTNSLSWMFKQLQRRLTREEQAKGSSWTTWTETVTSEQVVETRELGSALRKAVTAKLEDAAGPVLDELAKVDDWLRAFAQVVYKPEPEEEPEAEEEPEETTKVGMPPVGAQMIGGVEVRGSYKLQLLIRKLQAFEQLIEQQKFQQAALVADDITQIKEAFDPVEYFPDLFATYSRLMALNVGSLTEFEELKESPDWRALQEFYKADLDGFLEMD